MYAGQGFQKCERSTAEGEILSCSGAYLLGKVLKSVAKFRLTCCHCSWVWQRSFVGKVRWSMWSVLSLPPPTIHPREQADLARYRSFVVKKCGFGF